MVSTPFSLFFAHKSVMPRVHSPHPERRAASKWTCNESQAKKTRCKDCRNPARFLVRRRCGSYVCESVQEQTGQVLAKIWALKAWLNQPVIRQVQAQVHSIFASHFVFMPRRLTDITRDKTDQWDSWKVGQHARECANYTFKYVYTIA